MFKNHHFRYHGPDLDRNL